MPNVVQDPTIVKTKGAPSKKKHGWKKRKCSHCKKSGHTIRKCPLLFSMDDSMAADQDISSSDSDEMINEFDESTKNNNDITSKISFRERASFIKS